MRNGCEGRAFVLPGTQGGFLGQISKSKPEKLHFAVQTSSRGNFTIPVPDAALDSWGGVRPSLQDFLAICRGGDRPATCWEVFPSFFGSTGAFWMKIVHLGFFCPCPTLIVVVEVLEPWKLLALICYFFPSIFSHCLFIGERRLIKTKGEVTHFGISTVYNCLKLRHKPGSEEHRTKKSGKNHWFLQSTSFLRGCKAAVR